MKNNTTLKEELIERARAKSICQPGYKRMLESDIDSLVDYYIETPDWCLTHNFPDFATIKDHFTGFESKGVFVGKTFHGELLNDLQAYIFHNCKGTIKVGLNVDKAIIPMLYLANGCRLHIVGVGEAKPKKPSEIPVYTFGHNDVSARSNMYVKFTHYKSELI